MKKLIFIFLVSLLASCSDVDVAPGPGPLVTTKDNVSFEENPEEIEIEVYNEVELSENDSPTRGDGVELGSVTSVEGGPYSNPFFIYGTDFGNYFQTMYTHGKYEQMLAFTSKESIDKFGKQEIIDFYKNELDFGYDIGNYPLSSGSDGDMIVINYEANIMATSKVIRLNVVVENDSCKIVLPDDLKRFPS